MSLPGERLQPQAHQEVEFDPKQPAPTQFTIENLRMLYSVEDVVTVYEHQREAHKNKTLLNKPVPTPTEKREPNEPLLAPKEDPTPKDRQEGSEKDSKESTRFEALCWNNAVYDDKIETFLDKDPIYQKLMELRSRGTPSEYKLLRAMRARRSTLALLYSYIGDELLGSEPDDTLGETPTEQSA